MQNPRLARWAALMAAALAAGCVLSPSGLRSAREPLADGWQEQRMVVSPSPPVIAATGPEDLALVVGRAERLDPESLFGRPGARRIGVTSLPWLVGAPEGRTFLETTGGRALARGMPDAGCPATHLATAPAEAPRAARAEAAVAGCLEALAGRTGCGCRLVALDDMVLVPQGDLAYATGVPARLRLARGGPDGLFVAEETRAGDLLLRDLGGIFGRVEHLAGNRVAVRLTGEPAAFDGVTLPVGFRRGRVAERIYAQDPQGRKLVLLVGFDPDELAGRAGGWLAWPADLGL